MPPNGFAFGSEYPLTETWLFGKPNKKELYDELVDIIHEVRKMKRDLLREPCMQDWVRENLPSMAHKLPAPAARGAAGGCEDVLAEFAVLGQLDWILTRWNDGDFHEVINGAKRRHREGTSYWVDTYDVEVALG